MVTEPYIVVIVALAVPCLVNPYNHHTASWPLDTENVWAQAMW